MIGSEVDRRQENCVWLCAGSYMLQWAVQAKFRPYMTFYFRRFGQNPAPGRPLVGPIDTSKSSQCHQYFYVVVHSYYIVNNDPPGITDAE